MVYAVYVRVDRSCAVLHDTFTEESAANNRLSELVYGEKVVCYESDWDIPTDINIGTSSPNSDEIPF